MLLNLSNHHSSNWQPKQIEAAKKSYGEITDLNFPNIHPEWDELQVSELAKEYADKCVQAINKTVDTVNAIHVMGEMTFSYAFVKLVESYHIQCIASTTERVVTLNNNGEKISSFNFIKFRKYSKP